MKIFYNGKIVTMKEENDIQEALCIENGKIKLVGSNEDVLKLKDESTELVDLEGKSMYPGFIDPHSHFGMQSNFASFTLIAAPPIGVVDSIEKMIAVLKDGVENNYANDGSVFFAYGYDHEELAEKRHPTRDDLDKVSKDIPIIIAHASMHVGSLNSKAIEILGIKENEENPEGGFYGRYEGTDKINGYVEELAFQKNIFEILKMDHTKLDEIIKAGQEIYAKAGVTTVQDGWTGNEEFSLFKNAVDKDIIDLDVHAYPPAMKEFQKGNRWIEGEAGVKVGENIGGNGNVNFSGYKIVLDGSPQARTAFMSKPYEVVNENDDPNYVAYPFFEHDDVVIEGILYAMNQNKPFLVHCNGDGAGDQLLRCYEEALKQCKVEYTARPVMIHCQTIREDQIDKMAEYGIVPAMFPIHTYFWGDVHIQNFGRERANKISNQRYALSKGLLPTSHEDSPVLPPNTILSIWAACNRTTRTGQILGEELRLTRYEAIRTVTYNAAYQYSEEDIKGTIEAGKQADFVIPNVDLLTCSNDELFKAHAIETIKRGKTIYKK